MNKEIKDKPQQRVAEKDALIMLYKMLKNDNDKLQPATTYNEDYAGANQRFIREDIVESLIKKLTR